VQSVPGDPCSPQVEALRRQVAALDRRVFDLQSLLKAGQALHSQLALEPLCALILAMVCERARCAQAALLLLEPEGRALELRASRGLGEGAAGLRVEIEDGICWRLIAAGEPFSICDREGSPRFAALFAGQGLEALRGRVWAPMVVNGRVIGVLSLGAREGEEELPEGEFTFLGSLAAQAAVALSTAQLYQKIQVARGELDRSLHNLSMLFDVTRALGAISDLTRLLKLILNRAIAAVHAEKGSLMLLDEASGELVVRVVFGLPDKEVERRINDGELECQRFKRGEGVAGKVLATGAAMRVDQVGDGNFARAEGSHVRSILCVPLKVDDDVIGVINITNRQHERPFGPEDEHIMEALANQAAVAIARTRLYEAAITDGLTGLFVRRFVMHRFTEEHRRTRRYRSQLSVVMCDIDHFKRVNDTWGHQAGDAVIVAVAGALREGLRQDIDVIGRYGGEEFLLLLPQTGLRGAVRAAERMREAVARLRVEIGQPEPLQVTMSFGVTEVDPDLDEGEEPVLKRADDALYASKRRGRDRVCAGVAGDEELFDGVHILSPSWPDDPEEEEAPVALHAAPVAPDPMHDFSMGAVV
jgi:diguanylate cyclase (GGDEF)-like protein